MSVVLSHQACGICYSSHRRLICHFRVNNNPISVNENISSSSYSDGLRNNLMTHDCPIRVFLETSAGNNSKKSFLRIQGIRKSLALMANESYLVDKRRLPPNRSKGSWEMRRQSSGDVWGSEASTTYWASSYRSQSFLPLIYYMRMDFYDLQPKDNWLT